MLKPLATVMRADDMPGGACDTSQRTGLARRMHPDPFLDEAPRRFDGIEVGRVRRQEAQSGATPLDEPPDRRRRVRLEIVEEHDIAAAQARRQASTNPVLEPAGLHRPPAGPGRHPAARPDRADQGQVVPPIHRARFDIFLAPLHPRMRSAHRDIHACLIERDQPVEVNASDPALERLALLPNVGSVLFTRARPFFLSTYPARPMARRKLDAVVRSARPTRRLYARHSSSLVPSGRSRITAWRITRSIGLRQPPPRGRGATDSLARYCATHRSRVRYPMPNTAANSMYPPSPASYAATARPRNATSYGLGMAPVKYNSCVNSSAHRG